MARGRAPGGPRAGAGGRGGQQGRRSEPFDEEYRVRRPDGSVVWIHDRAVLIRADDGTPRFWLGFFHDVTHEEGGRDRARPGVRARARGGRATAVGGRGEGHVRRGRLARPALAADRDPGLGPDPAGARRLAVPRGPGRAPGRDHREVPPPCGARGRLLDLDRLRRGAATARAGPAGPGRPRDGRAGRDGPRRAPAGEPPAAARDRPARPRHGRADHREPPRERASDTRRRGAALAERGADRGRRRADRRGRRARGRRRSCARRCSSRSARVRRRDAPGAWAWGWPWCGGSRELHGGRAWVEERPRRRRLVPRHVRGRPECLPRGSDRLRPASELPEEPVDVVCRC